MAPCSLFAIFLVSVFVSSSVGYPHTYGHLRYEIDSTNAAASIGYLAFTSTGIITTAPDIATSMLVSIPVGVGSSLFSIRDQKAVTESLPFIAPVAWTPNTPLSVGYVLTESARTKPNAVPQFQYSTAFPTDLRQVQTDVWTIDPATNILTANCVDLDGSTPATYIVSNGIDFKVVPQSLYDSWGPNTLFGPYIKTTLKFVADCREQTTVEDDLILLSYGEPSSTVALSGSGYAFEYSEAESRMKFLPKGGNSLTLTGTVDPSIFQAAVLKIRASQPGAQSLTVSLYRNSVSIITETFSVTSDQEYYTLKFTSRMDAPYDSLSIQGVEGDQKPTPLFLEKVSLQRAECAYLI